ncbi:MAG TPA: peptidase S8 [Sedimenticola sp.]|nr:peptidase S8 [Sedimenticola sp.]
MSKHSQNTLLFIVLMNLWLFLPSAAMAGERRVIVGFHQTPGAAAEHKIIKRHRGKLRRKFRRIKALSARLTDQAIAELQSDPAVAYVEEDTPITAIEPEFGGSEYLEAWGVSHIGAASVHARGIKGAGVKIAILDTGIDYTHPDLDDNYRGGINIIDPANAADPFDDSWNSHGTHVAGIIAAQLNGNGVVGMAPEASLYAVKTLDAGGSGYISDLIAGIEWAVANDMDIVNMSIGMRKDSQALAEACANAWEAGVLLVAAAGNTGIFGLGDVLYPALYDSVIAVGATDANNTVHYISAAGAGIEFVAPGDNIYSTAVYGGYGLLTGTSQASPHVAGVAALVLSAGLDDLNGDGAADNRDLRIQLQDTALDLGEPGLDDTHGYGLVSAEAAVAKSLEKHLSLVQNRGGHRDNSRRVILKDAVYTVKLASNGVRKIMVKVFENNRYQRALSNIYSFGRPGVSRRRAKGPNGTTFTLDARGRTLNVIFIPRGRRGSSADIYINRR